MKRTRTLRTYSLFQKIVAYLLSAAIPLATLPGEALALPHGGVVSKGSATLGYSTGKLSIRQSTSSATFDWSSYNVKAGQSVVYSVPGSRSVSLNYIGGTTPSSIDGKVSSNGILEFMNPNGLIFGSGSVVSAAGVMAFGSATPWGKPTGPVSNAGVLTATDNGTVALVGTSVANLGTIAAPGGEVLLAAGTTVTPLATTGVSSLSVATTGGGLVDDSGIVSAETVDGKTGTILLESGMGSGTTTLASTAVLDASAPNGGNGGNITINANTVTLDNLAPLNVSAPYGKPGTIMIDPSTINTDVASCLETIDGNGTASNQSGYLADTINLTGNIDLESGSTLYSWIPLGTSSTSAFTGTFNGNGHTVSGYTITATGNMTGFIGALGSTGKVENLGVTGTVDGGTHCTIGGLVGYNNGGTISYSYATGTVSGSSGVGGLVGVNNSGTISYSYATGTVSGTGSVGGLVGANSGTISYSYATGNVSGTGSVGGLVGANSDTISNSYWNTTATATGIGSGSSSTGASGLSAAAFGSSSDFSGWTFNTWSGGKFISSATASPWFMGSVAYGTGTMNAPMLVSDLATATVTGNGTSVYNGSTVTAGYTTTTTMGGTTLSPNVTVTTAAVGPNAGRYTNTPTYTISAPTTQTSVDSVSAVPGTWTIAPATLTATANATSMTYGSSVPALSGTVTGFVDGQTLASDGGTASWTTSATSASKAGIYGITGSVSMTLGNPYFEDYTIVQAPGNSSALTITATGGGSSGSGTPEGITSDNFNPVIQTVNLYQKLPALPGISSAGTSSDNPSSPFPSGKSMTLDASQNSSLMVIQPGGDDTSPDGILSVEELKN